MALLVLVVAIATLGCGPRCAETARIKAELVARTARAPGAHAEVRVPFARANALIDQMLADEPLTAHVDIPALPAVGVGGHSLTAVARAVRMRAAPEGRIGFQIRLELDDSNDPVTTLALAAEVAPKVVHERGVTAVVVGFGPENLVGVRPELDDNARATLARAIARWLPADVRAHVPQFVLDAAVRELGEDIAGRAYELLQRTLLIRLGELTEMRIELPELPIASITPSPRPSALAIELALAIPVRAAVAPDALDDGDDIALRLSASAAAELANWAVDNGRLPRHYSRDLDPRPDGEYRPYFDYVAADRARPLKIHVVQERGGCAYFRVGMAPEVRVEGGKLVVELRDRWVERAVASPLVEAGLWLQQLVQGSIDSTRRGLARMRVSVGHRTVSGEVLRAGLIADELRFVIRLSLGARDR
jgi:hypothetical protein